MQVTKIGLNFGQERFPSSRDHSKRRGRLQPPFETGAAVAILFQDRTLPHWHGSLQQCAPLGAGADSVGS